MCILLVEILINIYIYQYVSLNLILIYIDFIDLYEEIYILFDN